MVDNHLLNAHEEPDTANVSCVPFPFILTTALSARYYYSLHCRGEEIMAFINYMSFPKVMIPRKQ
jgi:hypothetical protein